MAASRRFEIAELFPQPKEIILGEGISELAKDVRLSTSRVLPIQRKALRSILTMAGVRVVANKSKLKVGIIQRIDRKLSLRDIARAEGLEYEELLGEIYAIVKSGTRLNIDYYIDDLMDEDHMLDIYEYFRDESETDSIDEAMDELGSDYTEEEIRLVRIKFMSETAN